MNEVSLKQAAHNRRQEIVKRNQQLEPFLREHSQMGSGWLGEQLGLRPQHIQKIMKRLSIPLRPKTGPAPGRGHFWTGGRIVDKSGYILIYQPSHPYANRAGYVREHRLVMEKHLGRYLLPTEVVHHKDGTRDNNAIENLELLANNGDHIRSTVWLGKKHKPETIEKMRESAKRRYQTEEGMAHRLKVGRLSKARRQVASPMETVLDDVP